MNRIALKARAKHPRTSLIVIFVVAWPFPLLFKSLKHPPIPDSFPADVPISGYECRADATLSHSSLCLSFLSLRVKRSGDCFGCATGDWTWKRVLKY